MKTKVDIERIKKTIQEIDDNDLLNPKQIVEEKGLILNTNLEPSRFTLYRLIKNGKIEAVDMGTGKAPKYFVRGKDLKHYVKNKWNI